MILLLYILKSTLALSVLLLFYRFFLEKEKMHNFNRAFLLGAILLSFAVPFIPTGILFSSEEIQPIVDSVATSNISIPELLEQPVQEAVISPMVLTWTLYLLVLSFFMLKFGRNLFLLIKNAWDNDARYYKGARLVLLDDRISPYTFWNYIFVSRVDFENNKIEQKLLDHELTHAQQRHSWDILFIELVMLLFWFNPVLRWYKIAIQLNHEFLADSAVIDKYKTVKTYQYLLLDTIHNNNKISLASNINFHLTQKRLKMMTKKSSSLRKKVLILSLMPIVLALLISCGSPIVSQLSDAPSTELVQGDPGMDKDTYFADAIVHYTTEDGRTKVISYKSLDKDIKAKIPPPPPPPPTPPGTKQKKKAMKPLPKGTIVYLTDDGNIQIGNKKNGVKMVPPPPVAPKGAKSTLPTAAPVPPKPPAPPTMIDLIHDFTAPVPPEPPVPPTLDLFDEISTFYINGKKVSADKAKTILEDDHDKIKTIDIKQEDDESKSMYIVMK